MSPPATSGSSGAELRVVLVDPSLFTGPYDAGLTQGLVEAGVMLRWATRPTRPGDRHEIPRAYVDDYFYRRVDTLTGWPAPLRVLAKGLAHAAGLMELLWTVWRTRPHVVHVQWLVLPPMDALAYAMVRRLSRLVVTAHDTVPFNGSRLSIVQQAGIGRVLKMADAVIVHTQSGRDRLIGQGIAPDKLAVIAHGPLPLHALPTSGRGPRDLRATFVLFGEIKPYKGLDLLLDALSQLPPALRAQCRLVVAGRPRMDLAPLLARIEALGLQQTVEMRAQRQSEEQMADLFDDADCFVFPYRQVDASGVYFLVKPLAKWLIASRVGIFSEDMRDATDGRLIDPESVPQLTGSLAEYIQHRPQPAPASAESSWTGIGQATRALYERTLARHVGEAFLMGSAPIVGRSGDPRGE